MQSKTAEHYDVIIIGGGAAGVSAALWCDELGLRALLIELSDELGGQLLWTYNAIKNYLGIEVENGRELQKVFVKQLQSRKFELKTNCEVIEIDTENKQVRTKDNQCFLANALIIATGISRRKLNLEGEDRFKGRGIIESGKRDAEKAKDKKVCIIGGGDAALENALILSEFAESITLVHRRPAFRGRSEFIEKVQQNPKVKILTETITTKIIGNEFLEAVELTNLQTKQTFTCQTDILLLRLGVEPNTKLLHEKIELDENGYCLINSHCETTVKNIYAIGDVANPLAPTISGAVGMGASVAKIISQTHIS